MSGIKVYTISRVFKATFEIGRDGLRGALISTGFG